MKVLGVVKGVPAFHGDTTLAFVDNEQMNIVHRGLVSVCLRRAWE